MKKIILGYALVALALLTSCSKDTVDPQEGTIQSSSIYSAPSGKTVYIPEEFKDSDFTNKDSKWSYARCAYTDDIIIFWEKAFGDDISQTPDCNGVKMSVDIPNLLKRIQSFYDFYKNDLQFIKAGSNADKYRMIVQLQYLTDRTAMGGSYDDVIGALWIAPKRVQDEKLNCIAHELGHSFQAMVGIDNGGKCLDGSGFYEMASQWMLFQVNPEWPTDENEHWQSYCKQANLRFLDIKNIYNNAYVMEYWSEKHGLTVMSDIFREGRPGEDAAAVYMRLYNLTNEDFAKECCDCYSKLLTFDFKGKHEMNKQYTGEFVNSDSLQMYGANVIPLSLPSSIGNETSCVKVDFQGEGDENKDGFAYRIVAVNDSAQATYSNICTEYQGSAELTVPADTKRVYLVVTGYPLGKYESYTYNPYDANSKPVESYTYMYSYRQR